MTRPARLDEGIAHFNAREFFEAHEVWEELWREEHEPERQFTQGLIQLAVACYHLDRDNFVGAVKLYTRAIGRIKQFDSRHLGLDVDSLIAASEKLLLAAQKNTSVVHFPRITSTPLA